MIELGIEQRLAADTTIAGLAAARIFPVVLPEAFVVPTGKGAITYQLISSPEEYTIDGPLGLVRARMQIDCWAKRYGLAKMLAQAVRMSLNGFYGSLPDGTQVFETECDDASDGYEAEGTLYRCQSDWILLYQG